MSDFPNRPEEHLQNPTPAEPSENESGQTSPSPESSNVPASPSPQADKPVEPTPAPAQPAPELAAAEEEQAADVSDQELKEALGELSNDDVERMAANAPQDEMRPEPDKIQEGTVVRVTAEEVFLDLGGKSQGAIPLIEFAGQPLPIEGDKIAVIVEREDRQSGLLVLSKRQADEMTFWEQVKPGDIIEGVVTGMNKGGLDIDIGGARAFMPTSQVDSRRLHDISVLIGQHIKAVVSQVDRATHDLIISRRKYLDKEKKEQKKALLEAIKEGDVRTGEVSNLTEFGAFIDLGGADGLLHITDMSWGHVKHPSEIVQVGQQVEVQVLRINQETGKISLGLKQIKPNPWDGIENKYPEHTRINGKIARITDFGAFIELEEGVDALLPISEMSWSKRIGHPSEVVKTGDEVEVEILKVDPIKKRISVGLKQTEENPWSSVDTRFPVDMTLKGKVSKLTDFGAFVELVPGVEGLIHISELSDRRVKSVGEVVQENQEVEVRVIKVDKENQRISLSMKPKTSPTEHSHRDAGQDAGRDKPRKRKKQLRGGLSSHFEW